MDFGADFNASANVDVSASLDASLSAAASFDASASFGASASFDANAQLSLGKAKSKCAVGDHVPDPWLKFRFKVRIIGVPGKLRFQKVETLSLRSEPARGISGGRPGAATSLPPRTWTWEPVTLKRGMASDGTDIWQWVMDTVTKPRITPHDVEVTLVDEEGKLAMQWTFVRAYPVAWNFEPLDATAKENAVLIETLKLEHQGVTIQFGNRKYQNTGAPQPSSPNTPNSPSAGGGSRNGGGANSSQNRAPAGGNQGGASRTGNSIGANGSGTSGPPPSNAEQPHRR